MIKIKVLLFTFFLITSSYLCSAQLYGNEWINYNQDYFKIKIVENGIYKLTRSELLAGGFPIETIDPRKIQLFYLGQEIAIQVTGQTDGIFGANDFIAFYGKRNDGTSDTALYLNESDQPHTYYSLFSDSSAYFLTYRLDNDFGLRMEEYAENNIDGLAPETYYGDTSLTVLSSAYFEGQSYGFTNEILLGSYDISEGWTGPRVTLNQSTDNTIVGIENTYELAELPHLELLLTGRNNNAHNVTILVGPSTASLRSLTIAEFDKDETYLVEEDLAWTDISPTGELVVRATVNGVDGIQDNISVSYVKLDYNKSFDLNNQSEQYISLSANTNNKSYIEASNQPENPILLDITTINNPIVIGVNDLADELNAIINYTASERQLFLQSDYKTVGSINLVEFQNFDPSSYNYLIISHPDLRLNTSDSQSDQVKAYVDYRSSAVGGGHQVFDIDIEDVFNQFGYGLPSPMAIRKISQYIYDNGELNYLFLIGKSSNVQGNYYRQDPETVTFRHFVPTYGYPGGDAPFTSGFDGGLSYEAVPTGRINASEPDHIQAYLNKVIEKEALPFDDLRRKNLILLSGGRTEQELNLFRSYIDDFESSAQDIVFGGESAKVSKNNNSAVELINISDEINEGVSMVTFFGHSSGSVTDIEIGLVSDPSFGYNNKAKYPVFIVNGCLSGDFFSENESFGVDWILTPDLGATAFMAHSHVGFSSPLKRYSQNFYEVAFNDSTFTARGVGDIKREAAKILINNSGDSEQNIAQVQLFNLQGDPAAKVFGASQSNYGIDEDLISLKTFDNEQLISSLDSFYLEFDVKNFGIYDQTPLPIQVTRTLADGNKIVYGPIIYDPVLRQDTLFFTINNEINNPSGQNSFTIELDPFSDIEESNKNNNSATLDVFLSNGSSLNLLPQNYGVYSNSSIAFYFQSANITSGVREFDIQIDTLKSFNSSYLTEATISANIVGNFNFDLQSKGNIANGKVFYWRTRLSNPEPDEIDEWVESSFTYDNTESEGWIMKSTNQLAESNLEGISINTESGLWEFETSSLDLLVQNYGSNHVSSTFEDTKVLVNNRNYFNSNSSLNAATCTNNSINFLAFQRQSLAPFRPINFTTPDELNPIVCGTLPQYIMNYTTSEMNNTNGPVEYIDALSNGDLVLVFSLGSVEVSSWSETFKSSLQTLGINSLSIDALTDDEPFIFLGVKNGTASNEIAAITSPKNEATLVLETTLEGDFDTGMISTNKIGPALSWDNIELLLNGSANPDDDLIDFSYTGITNNGTEELLGNSPSIMNYDLSTIDATVYPYLRLNLQLSDNVEFTPSQLDEWHVHYETAPEGVLLVNENTGLSDSLNVQQGQEANSSFTFWNISTKDFSDSIDVAIELQNLDKSLTIEDSLSIVPLAAGDSVAFNIPLTTAGNTGSNDLLVSVNESRQREVYLTNNNARLTDFLFVQDDNVNPVLNVTIDGLRIMDGDIVSPTPDILISMTDDNHYLIKDDTVGMNFFIKHPCENCDFERISFSDPSVVWSPANEQDDFSIQYTPSRLEDGIYQLRAQVSDASGNASGVLPYEISFEVINASTISNFYPYPNPFSSSTRFVFTLTGEEIPEDIKIQIMTISGRIVKEIFMNELGNIRIGNNITEYAWDGRDNYGDQLANGVYLYRVMIKNPGENFKHKETNGDRGFKNGFGKMYLLR